MRVRGLWEGEWPTSDEWQKYCTPRVNKNVAFSFFENCVGVCWIPYRLGA